MASAEMTVVVRVRGQWRLRVASWLAPALPVRWRVAVARWAVRGTVVELLSSSERVLTQEPMSERYVIGLDDLDG